MVVTMLSVIWGFNVFNQIWLVFSGRSEQHDSHHRYFHVQKEFVNFDIGQGAAISEITVILLMILTSVYIRNLLKSGEDL